LDALSRDVRKLFLIVSLATLALAFTADAAFRGRDGRIAFAMGTGNVDVYSANPDGSGQGQTPRAPSSVRIGAWAR
jgi:hypothetical protein